MVRAVDHKTIPMPRKNKKRFDFSINNIPKVTVNKGPMIPVANNPNPITPYLSMILFNLPFDFSVFFFPYIRSIHSLRAVPEKKRTNTAVSDPKAVNTAIIYGEAPIAKPKGTALYIPEIPAK